MPLPGPLAEEIQQALERRFNEPVRIDGTSPVGGGCISNTQRLDTDHGPFFLKTNSTSPAGMFTAEAKGLAALHGVGVLPVPEPISVAETEGARPAYLLTTWLEPGSPGPDFFEDFGRRFALLHRKGTGERYGFESDNFLGSTPQPNGWSDDWVAFFREKRLGYQLRLARRNGYTGELQRLGDRLLGRLDGYLRAPEEPPTLLHGDLWNGNYLCNSAGQAVIIDPATYYGRREADLAMTHLFGGFSRAFYRAYEEEWPLAPGSEDRLEIYKLYHLLNHLNLFGSGYLGGCLSVLRRYA